uniref:Uncharacterized protein n=1 Tax=Spongospora subterranea TaxID=70186 RepID=A0A0H5RET5_9EUKA|eukprot:CRZ07119.1 hypothetical protein [Spongospora subterranea]
MQNRKCANLYASVSVGFRELVWRRMIPLFTFLCEVERGNSCGPSNSCKGPSLSQSHARYSEELSTCFCFRPQYFLAMGNVCSNASGNQGLISAAPNSANRYPVCPVLVGNVGKTALCRVPTVVEHCQKTLINSASLAVVQHEPGSYIRPTYIENDLTAFLMT